jgi:hypothetical protein
MILDRPISPRRPSPALRAVALLALAALAASAGGCQAAGLLAYAIGGDTKTVSKKAQYRGLEGKTVAVLIDLDSETALRYNAAQVNLCTSISSALAQAGAEGPGARPADPRQIIKFQKDNPYWSTRPYSQLLRDLKVDRLVIVDVSEFSDHEPGNAAVWQGVVEANVLVAAAESTNPDDPLLRTGVHAEFPEDRPEGMLNSDGTTIEFGMLTTFAGKVSGLFYDHTEEVKR